MDFLAEYGFPSRIWIFQQNMDFPAEYGFFQRNTDFPVEYGFWWSLSGHFLVTVWLLSSDFPATPEIKKHAPGWI